MMNSTEPVTILAGMRPGHCETRTFMTMPGMRFVSRIIMTRSRLSRSTYYA